MALSKIPSRRLRMSLTLLTWMVGIVRTRWKVWTLWWWSLILLMVWAKIAWMAMGGTRCRLVILRLMHVMVLRVAVRYTCVYILASTLVRLRRLLILSWLTLLVSALLARGRGWTTRWSLCTPCLMWLLMALVRLCKVTRTVCKVRRDLVLLMVKWLT